MKLAVIGTGYVGLVTGTCFAEMGNDVICVDKDESKVDTLKQGISPIYEPQLEALLDYNLTEGRLTFTSDLKTAVEESEIVFIAVGTPQADDGSADLTFVHTVAESIGKALNKKTVIAIKSTVPVGTCKIVEDIIAENTSHPFTVVSNPEFLKQGDAVNDCMKPDRIIVGCDDDYAKEKMQELYSPFMRTGNRLLIMDRTSSELTKYVANAFLATKISFMNEMARISEKVGADIEAIRYGISTDNRIGNKFLFAGLGYGGSCFPKDVKALHKTAQDLGIKTKLLESVHDINYEQRIDFFNKVYQHFNGDLIGKRVALWGLTFKPNTDDTREAPSITIIEKLLEHGADIHAYDPKGTKNIKTIFGNKVTLHENRYDVLSEAECLLIMTEWNEFRRPNFEKIERLMKNKVIFDGRNLYDQKRLAERGFDYASIGRL